MCLTENQGLLHLCIETKISAEEQKFLLVSRYKKNCYMSCGIVIVLLPMYDGCVTE